MLWGRGQGVPIRKLGSRMFHDSACWKTVVPVYSWGKAHPGQGLGVAFSGEDPLPSIRSSHLPWKYISSLTLVSLLPTQQPSCGLNPNSSIYSAALSCVWRSGFSSRSPHSGWSSSLCEKTRGCYITTLDKTKWGQLERPQGLSLLGKFSTIPLPPAAVSTSSENKIPLLISVLLLHKNTSEYFGVTWFLSKALTISLLPFGFSMSYLLFLSHSPHLLLTLLIFSFSCSSLTFWNFPKLLFLAVSSLK